MTIAGMKAIVAVLNQEADPELQEACTDAICKIATPPKNRQMLVQQVPIHHAVEITMTMSGCLAVGHWCLLHSKAKKLEGANLQVTSSTASGTQAYDHMCDGL